MLTLKIIFFCVRIFFWTLYEYAKLLIVLKDWDAGLFVSRFFYLSIFLFFHFHTLKDCVKVGLARILKPGKHMIPLGVFSGFVF